MLSRGLPADLAASVFVVVHTSLESPGYLGEIFARAGPLPARYARDGEPIKSGAILVAPADYHLVLTSETVRLSRGPRENRTRPAIDPLFRSAAAIFSSRVIGVILTGMLDDGAAGLAAIKRCGGVAVVQDPEDASFPGMPTQALAAVVADFRLPLAEISGTLARLVGEPAPAAPAVPVEIAREAEMARSIGGDPRPMDPAWSPSPYSCPDCGGVLQTAPDETVLRYRCWVGHAYTASHLLQGQQEQTEEAVWAAIRRQEEHATLLTRLAERATGRTAESYRRRAKEARQHSLRLRSLFLASGHRDISGPLAQIPAGRSGDST